MAILIIGGVGYIGSALFKYLEKDYEVDTVDLEWFGNFINKNNLCMNYKDLSIDFLDKYDTVILLAAHSSVQMCQNEELSAFRNNVANFIELLYKLKNQKFIYASSSSVYGMNESISTEDFCFFVPSNYYDLTKQNIDHYASLSKINYYALRFGTVNGFSNNIRDDIMINKMYFSSLQGKIEIYNSGIYRPILGLNDLCRAIKAIIDQNIPIGVYNLASFNATVGEIAEKVSSLLKIPLIDKGNSISYNFRISTEKFRKLANFSFNDSVESIVHSFEGKKLNKGNRNVKQFI